MKVVGRLFLIISGILFLVWGIYGLVDYLKQIGNTFSSGNMMTIVTWVIAIAACVVEIFAAIGGFFFAAGSKKFAGFVGFFAFINLVIIIANLVTTIVAAGGAPVIWLPSVAMATSIIYVLGWAFVRR